MSEENPDKNDNSNKSNTFPTQKHEKTEVVEKMIQKKEKMKDLIANFKEKNSKKIENKGKDDSVTSSNLISNNADINVTNATSTANFKNDNYSKSNAESDKSGIIDKLNDKYSEYKQKQNILDYKYTEYKYYLLYSKLSMFGLFLLSSGTLIYYGPIKGRIKVNFEPAVIVPMAVTLFSYYLLHSYFKLKYEKTKIDNSGKFPKI